MPNYCVTCYGCSGDQNCCNSDPNNCPPECNGRCGGDCEYNDACNYGVFTTQSAANDHLYNNCLGLGTVSECDGCGDLGIGPYGGSVASPWAQPTCDEVSPGSTAVGVNSGQNFCCAPPDQDGGDSTPQPPTFDDPFIPCLAGAGGILPSQRQILKKILEYMSNYEALIGSGPEALIRNRDFPNNLPPDLLKDPNVVNWLQKMKNADPNGNAWREILDNIRRSSKLPTRPPICSGPKTPIPKTEPPISKPNPSPRPPKNPTTPKTSPPVSKPLPPTTRKKPPINWPKLPQVPKFKPPTFRPGPMPPILKPGIIGAIPIIILDPISNPIGDGEFYPGRWVPPLEDHGGGRFDDWPVWDDGPIFEPPGGFPLPPIVITDPETGEPIFFDDIDDYSDWLDDYFGNTTPEIDPPDYFFQQSIAYLDGTDDQRGAKIRTGNAIYLFMQYGGYIPVWPMYLSDYYPRIKTVFLAQKYHIQNKDTAQSPQPNNFLAKSNNGNAIIELDSSPNPAKFATDIADLTDENTSLINGTLLELYGGNPPLTEVTALVPKE